MTAFVGVDLGGTQIRVILRDADGNIVSRASALTQASDGQEQVIARIIETVRQAVGATPWGAIQGIGIGVPGPVDPWTGVVLQAPNLPGWRDVPIRAIVQSAFGVPVEVGNDANLAALGEHMYGAGVGVANLIYVTISTGIGGGIIADGKLLLGAKGLAGEFGHQTLVPDGPLCGCGNRGCLEALGSGTAIARMAREAVTRGQGQKLLELAQGSVEALDARIVASAARAGDAVAQDILRCAATYVGIGLANVVNILNPELIVLGGGVTRMGELLFDPVREVIAQRAMPAMRAVRIVPAALGGDVVLFGAVALIANALKGE